MEDRQRERAVKNDEKRAGSSLFIPCSGGNVKKRWAVGGDVQRATDEQERPCGEVRNRREKAKSHLGQNARKEAMSGIKR